MCNVADQHGRAFECMIAQAMIVRWGARLTPEAQADQERDAARVAQLPPDLFQTFWAASNQIVTILQNRGPCFNNCSLDRLSDTEARDGDVTDIRLSLLDGSIINLSVKNNHFALKHQRPNSLMKQLGIPIGSEQDRSYRVRLSAIYGDFYRNARELLPQVQYFRELNDVQDDFISSHLYHPVCEQVAATLNTFLNAGSCQTYFTFLVGNTNFTKIILCRGCLRFEDYSGVPTTQQCIVNYSVGRPQYIFLDFDNQWSLSLRLHTAASSIGTRTPSLKFDTQPVRCPVPHIEYPLFR